jgi:hypothetical protein
VVEINDDGERPRMDIIRGSLAPDNAMPSRLNAELGDVFDALYPNAGAIFGDKVEVAHSAACSRAWQPRSPRWLAVAAPGQRRYALAEKFG